jgi:carbon monoxide dehydrogenase subunit G
VQLQHSFSVPIGVEEAWEAFTDIERIAPCLPGAAITSVDGDEFTGTAKVKLGPISLQYAGKGTWVSRDPATYSAVIEAQGKDKRGNGTAGATISAHLEPEGTSTRVVVDTELKITGRPAQFGRGVIQDVGGKLLDQFAACLVTRLVEPATVGADAGSATSEGPGPVPAATPAAAATTATDEGSASPGATSPAASTVGGTSAGDQAGVGRPTSSPGPATHAAQSPSEPVELDLGGVVGPVLLKRLAPVGAALLALVLLVRRLRRH